MHYPLVRSIELLESRIAPAALTIAHPVPDVVAGIGKTGASIDLGNMFDANGSYHTLVTFHTNFAAGSQGDIQIELFDDTTPLEAQNFLAYVTHGDYANTFFHRLVDAQGGLQILQGGSYKTNFKPVIAKPAVLNEFETAYPGYGTSTTDGLSANVAGTIAFAKPPNSPNGATDGFFINLADNSSSLDSQNGGFTPFGKLTDASLTLVNQIAHSANIVSLTGARVSDFNTVPTINGYSLATNKLPTPAQLLDITSATAAPLHDGVSQNITFSLVSVVDKGTTHTSNLVTATLVGDQLNLAYAPYGSGVATVTILATNNVSGDTATDSFDVTVKPDLVLGGLKDTLPSVIVPGDTGKATVVLGDSTTSYQGHVDVKFFLVGDNVPDVLIGSKTNVALKLAGGGSTPISADLKVPGVLSTGNPTYQVAAVVSPSGGDASTLNNTTFDGLPHQEINAFGTFGAASGLRTNVPITYTDSAQNLVTLTMKGGGYGLLFQNSDGLDLQLESPNGKTALSALSVGGPTSLHTIFVHQPTAPEAARFSLGTVAFGAVNVTGDFLADGGAKSVTLGDLHSTDGSTHLVSLGNFSESSSQKVAISLGHVTDYNLQSIQAVSSLKVLDWMNSNSTAEKIATYYLDSFSDQGNLQASVSVLASAPVKTFNVAGVVQHSTVHISGNVGAVTLGGIDTSNFFVGVTTLPHHSTGSSDPAVNFDAFDTIGSFKITGALIDSQIAGAHFGNVVLDGISPGAATGFYGFTVDTIAKYQVAATKDANIHTTGYHDVVGNQSGVFYAVQVL